jgi:predicted molibdopterin-dependent oxidoreductase YjgC
MYGLPGGATDWKVAGLLNNTAQTSGVVSTIASAANPKTATYTNTTNNINALYALFTVSGKGVINWAGVQTSVPTGGDFRGVLEIDGVRLLDVTVAGPSYPGLLFIGGGNGSATANAVATFQPVPFYSGFKILVASTFSSSATQTGYVNAEIYA